MALFLSLFLVLLLPPGGSARADAGALALLKQPGTFAMMRHALAPGTGDPQRVEVGNCDTQRNLDGTGREQARRTGDMLRDAGLEFTRVLTSQWCRCRDTATLMAVGPVHDLPSLNSFFRDLENEDRQTAETLSFLGGLGPEEKVLLVTHQVNITALTGRFTTSGEILVFRLEDDGTIRVLDELLVDP